MNLPLFARYGDIMPNSNQPTKRLTRIVAALVQDDARRVLLVRKKGTRAFMQPGGKLRESESHLAALERELSEELIVRYGPAARLFWARLPRPRRTRVAAWWKPHCTAWNSWVPSTPL